MAPFHEVGARGARGVFGFFASFCGFLKLLFLVGFLGGEVCAGHPVPLEPLVGPVEPHLGRLNLARQGKAKETTKNGATMCGGVGFTIWRMLPRLLHALFLGTNEARPCSRKLEHSKYTGHDKTEKDTRMDRTLV